MPALTFDDIDGDAPQNNALRFDDAPAQRIGFFDRMSTNYDKRIAEGKVGVDAYRRGEQSLPTTYLDVIGKTGAGTVNDAIVESVRSLASYAPQGVKDAVGNIRSYVMGSDLGRAASSAAGYVGDQYASVKERHPDAARHVEALSNIGLLLPVPTTISKGAGLASTALDASKNTAKNLTISGLEKFPAIDNGLGKLVRPDIETLGNAVKNASKASYKKAGALGGILDGQMTNDFLDHMRNFSSRDPMAVRISGENPIARIADDLNDFRDQPMTLERAMEIDKALTDRLDDAVFTDKNGALNNNGLQLIEVKNNLRDSLKLAFDKGYIKNGSKEGVDAYFRAVKDWSAQSQINEIQRIVDRASYMDNPATALKTGFRNIAVNPSRLSKYSPDVQKAIKNAARDGNIANIMRTELGSRLMSSLVGSLAGGAATGPVGAVGGATAGFFTARTARGAAEKMQMGRVNKVIDKIAAQSSVPDARLPLSQIMKMKPKDAKEALKKYNKTPAAAAPLALTIRPSDKK